MGRVLERTPTVTQIGFDVMEAASIIGLTQTGGERYDDDKHPIWHQCA